MEQFHWNSSIGTVPLEQLKRTRHRRRSKSDQQFVDEAFDRLLDQVQTVLGQVDSLHVLGGWRAGSPLPLRSSEIRSRPCEQLSFLAQLSFLVRLRFAGQLVHRVVDGLVDVLGDLIDHLHQFVLVREQHLVRVR